MSNTRVTFRKRTWGAWAGDIRELRAIGNILEESIRERQLTAAAELSDQIDALESNSSDDSDINRNKLSRLKASYERIILGKPKLFVRIDVVDQHEMVSGQVEDVLAELDRRSTKSVTFVASPYRYLAGDIHDDVERGSDLEEGIFIQLGKESRYHFNGAEVSVFSPSPGWTRSTFARIVDEIEKGVPRWAAVRKGSFTPVLVLAVLFGTVGLAIGLALQDYMRDWWYFPTFGSLLGFMSIPMEFGQKFFNWAFPRFEITGEGGQSSGARRIGVLLSLLASVPIGIFVNLVS
jgi:hypothetical protein